MGFGTTLAVLTLTTSIVNSHVIPQLRHDLHEENAMISISGLSRLDIWLSGWAGIDGKPFILRIGEDELNVQGVHKITPIPVTNPPELEDHKHDTTNILHDSSTTKTMEELIEPPSQLHHVHPQNHHGITGLHLPQHAVPQIIKKEPEHTPPKVEVSDPTVHTDIPKVQLGSEENMALPHSMIKAPIPHMEPVHSTPDVSEHKDILKHEEHDKIHNHDPLKTAPVPVHKIEDARVASEKVVRDVGHHNVPKINDELKDHSHHDLPKTNHKDETHPHHQESMIETVDIPAQQETIQIPPEHHDLSKTNDLIKHKDETPHHPHHQESIIKSVDKPSHQETIHTPPEHHGLPKTNDLPDHKHETHNQETIVNTNATPLHKEIIHTPPEHHNHHDLPKTNHKDETHHPHHQESIIKTNHTPLHKETVHSPPEHHNHHDLPKTNGSIDHKHEAHHPHHQESIIKTNDTPHHKETVHKTDKISHNFNHHDPIKTTDLPHHQKNIHYKTDDITEHKILEKNKDLIHATADKLHDIDHRAYYNTYPEPILNVPTPSKEIVQISDKAPHHTVHHSATDVKVKSPAHDEHPRLHDKKIVQNPKVSIHKTWHNEPIMWDDLYYDERWNTRDSHVQHLNKLKNSNYGYEHWEDDGHRQKFVYSNKGHGGHSDWDGWYDDK